MLKPLYGWVVRFPKITLAVIALITLALASQLTKLRWETDARVYLPKGHAAILYDERVDEVFGVKDSIIVGIVNEQEGIFNPTTLARIARLTEKIAALEGVVAQRTLDVASLSTAQVFVGDEVSLQAQRLMPKPPTSASDIAALRKVIYDNPDLFVGNLVSRDGKAAMIRAKIKEGIQHRYMTYFQIKALLATEEGKPSSWWPGGGGDWNKSASTQGAPASKWPAQGQEKSWPSADTPPPAAGAQLALQDKFYLAGRPVIEVTSGQLAQQDMQLMIPLLLAMIIIMLFAVFRTGRGVVLPLFVMGAGIVWTMGSMAALDVPLYTISTMLPVILVAVGIGNGIHLLSHYYDTALRDLHRPAADIVREVMGQLGPPLMTTSMTTAAGFLSLLAAEMPPFRTFGVFTVVGVVYCWLISVTFIPAMLTLMKPKVGGYLEKRRALRVHTETDGVTRTLVRAGEMMIRHRHAMLAGVLILSLISIFGVTRLYVDSSWMSDFPADSEVAQATQMLNNKFNGTTFLHVVVEGASPDALKSLPLLHKMEALQNYAKTLPHVGGALSVVDFLRSLNKTLHAGDARFETLPATQSEVGEYLYLLAVGGQPELLREVVDSGYRQAVISLAIKTDHTEDLKRVIDAVQAYAQREIVPLGVKVNLAGSANNSYIWATLLIDSQALSIILSKLTIFLLAALLFKSLRAGLLTVVPVTVTTLLIAGAAGLLGIAVDVSTTLAAGVAIGVGVDYAIHYLFKYRQEAGRGHLAATQETLRTVGRTVVFNAVVVAIGFMTLFFSAFPPNQKLGYFVAAYMLVSCLSAVLLLPVILSYFKSSRVREPVAHG